jgi:hypothetical protein
MTHIRERERERERERATKAGLDDTHASNA